MDFYLCHFYFMLHSIIFLLFVFLFLFNENYFSNWEREVNSEKRFEVVRKSCRPLMNFVFFCIQFNS